MTNGARTDVVLAELGLAKVASQSGDVLGQRPQEAHSLKREAEVKTSGEDTGRTRAFK
jgi:hypothetical protein